MDTTQLVRQHFLPEYTPLSRGHISGVVELVAGKPKQKAAVTAFTDLLMVILPGASSEALYGPCKWGAIHGSRLPAVGAEVQVGVDETNHPVVLWWEGEQKEPFKLGTPGAALVRETSKKLLVSATKDALVTATVWFNAEAGTVHFKVGASEVAILNNGGAAMLTSTSFPVPAGIEWEGTLEGKIKELLASYTFLD